MSGARVRHRRSLALDLVEPGGRVAYIGLAGQPSLIDTRALALKDVTAVGGPGGRRPSMRVFS